MLSLFLSYSREFNIEEFAFYVEDFAKVTQEKATIYSKDDELDVIECLPRYPFRFSIFIDTNCVLINNAFIAIREFDEIVSLHRMDQKNSTKTVEESDVKILANLEYNVHGRIAGIADLNIILLQSQEFKMLGHSRLKGWSHIFRHMKSREHFFPFVAISNEITLKLKTKY